MYVGTNYNWIGFPVEAHENQFSEKGRATTDPRPRTDSSWQGEYKYNGYILCDLFLASDFFKTRENRVSTKICTAELDLHRRRLLCRGLRSF